MLANLLVSLCNASPALRRLLWRWWYGRLAKRIRSGAWTFMNYGLDVSDPALTLQPQDEPDRLCIQLYHRVAGAVPLAGKEVLEVGCGRGGGTGFIARYHHPKAITGIDFSATAIALCVGRPVPQNAAFRVGDAERLPFPDASFDAVVNVESSHCYGSFPTFVDGVARVLRDGGHFLFADLREAGEMPGLESFLRAHAELEVIAVEDITSRVASALVVDEQRKRAMIEELVPAAQRALFDEFAGLAGSKILTGLQTGSILYRRFVLCRRPR